MLLSDVKLDVMMFTELKFTLEGQHKGKFDVSQNDVKLGVTIYLSILLFQISDNYSYLSKSYICIILHYRLNVRSDIDCTANKFTVSGQLSWIICAKYSGTLTYECPNIQVF